MSPIIVNAGVNEVVVIAYSADYGLLGGLWAAQDLLIYKLNCLQSGKWQLCYLLMLKKAT